MGGDWEGKRWGKRQECERVEEYRVAVPQLDAEGIS